MPLILQTPPAVVTTCRAPNDPAGREWSLVREGRGPSAHWALAFRSRALAKPSVALPLPAAAPTVREDGVSLDFHTANGGRRVVLDVSRARPSTIDVFVNFELEVNIERDLDRAVDAMNTEGPLTVDCSLEPAAIVGRAAEWMVGAGQAWSFDLLQSAGGRRYLATSVSWGRDLTADVGPGALRGRLMWAVEATPVYWQRAPSSTFGIGIAPLVWRWRFVPRARAAPFAELAFGGLFTRDPVPEGTEAANFVAHGALGLRWHPARRLALVTAYRFQHISNGNQSPTNPGVNAHVAWLGLGWSTSRR